MQSAESSAGAADARAAALPHRLGDVRRVPGPRGGGAEQRLDDMPRDPDAGQGRGQHSCV